MTGSGPLGVLLHPGTSLLPEASRSGRDALDQCADTRPVSRRFYVHERSFGYLAAAQPIVLDDLGHALGLSAASRAAAQFADDLNLMGRDDDAARLLGRVDALALAAAAALQDAFQLFIQLVPDRFGATEVLLGRHEQVNAWCYEDGYFTYATDEVQADIMYAETGSLKALRSQIRRAPQSEPALQMISGEALFLYDRRIGIGPGTAKEYRAQHARLLRRAVAPDLDRVRQLTQVHAVLDTTFPEPGDTLILQMLDACRRRAALTVAQLIRSMPGPAPTTGSAQGSRSPGQS